MSRFQEKLRLDPPAERVFRSQKTISVFRFHDPQYLCSGTEFWKNWVDDPRKWRQRGRYAGVDLNPGSYFAWSKEAAEAEMRFYSHNQPPPEPKAEIRMSVSHHGILNLTEQDAMEFIFSELISFAYRRKTVWLALLASLKKQGNLLTDYIGGWAFHKGYTGIMFLSARALEPHRTNFDSSALQEGWGMYWTQQADEFDYTVLDVMEMEIRPVVSKYANVVYFDGARLIRGIDRFSIQYPGRKPVTAKNPFHKLPLDEIRQQLNLPSCEEEKRQSLEKMEEMQQKVDAACADIQSLADRHYNRQLFNQEFGELLEDRLLSL